MIMRREILVEWALMRVAESWARERGSGGCWEVVSEGDCWVLVEDEGRFWLMLLTVASSWEVSAMALETTVSSVLRAVVDAILRGAFGVRQLVMRSL